MLLAVGACLAAAGCGRKATVEDCEQIVRRIAELELQGVVPKEELNTEVNQAQQNFRERALADCVGRRITQKSLACVATAKTAEAVIDDCFD
jgi:N-acetylglutamate synthase-like GNAT family acetyltransferase